MKRSAKASWIYDIKIRDIRKITQGNISNKSFEKMDVLLK